MIDLIIVPKLPVKPIDMRTIVCYSASQEP